MNGQKLGTIVSIQISRSSYFSIGVGRFRILGGGGGGGPRGGQISSRHMTS